MPSLVVDAPAAVEAVLRLSELARLNSFDLIKDEGYQVLLVELALDFPFLTLADLLAIVKLGIKGKLDTYKAQPLNFTRVYGWIEQQAPRTLGYWQQRLPELLTWAGQANVLAEFADLAGQVEQPAQFASVAGARIGALVKAKHYPTISPLLLFNTQPETEATALEWASYKRLTTEAWPTLLEKYPLFAGYQSQLIPLS